MSNKNDVTGDSIANIKGDYESYSENFGRIFGERLRRSNPRDFAGSDIITCECCNKEFVGNYNHTLCGLCDV